MYERMLDKENEPSEQQFLAHLGSARESFLSLDLYLLTELNLQKTLRFPYGKSYGWGYHYVKKSRHICDVFAEKESFTVMLRMDNASYESVYDEVSDDAKKCVDNKYPCGNGGWAHFRVLNETHLADVKTMLSKRVLSK